MMTRNSAKLSVVLFAAMIALPASADLKQKIAETTLKAKIPLVNLDVNSWTGVEGNYGIEISPNIDKNSYSRRERLNFKFQLGNGYEGKLGVLGRSTINAEFIRQFPSQRSALSIVGESRPYSPVDAPHSAEKAQKLKRNDYYAVEMRTALELSASTANLTGIALSGFEAKYIVSGDFRIEVYRRSGSKVFVRASSLKEKSTGLHFLSNSNYQFDVFSFDAGNNFLDKRLNVTLLDLDIGSRSSGKLFTIELEYDLSKQGARDAYESLMNPLKWKITDLAVVNPMRAKSSETVRKILVGKVLESRSLARTSGGGILEQSQSETDFIKKTNGLKLNLLLGQSRRSKSYLEQDFQFRTDALASKADKYKIATLSLDRNYDIFLGLRERDLIKEATIIFELDDSFALRDFEELSFSYQRSDIKLKSKSCEHMRNANSNNRFRFCQDETSDVVGQFRKMLPESLHAEIQFEELVSSYIGESVSIDIDLALSPQALDLLHHLSDSEIKDVVERFVSQVRAKVESRDDRKYYGELDFVASVDQKRGEGQSSIDDFYSSRTDEIVNSLQFVFKHTKDKQVMLAQWKELLKLQKNLLFRDLGSGLISRLLERSAQARGRHGLKKVLSFQVAVNSSGKSPYLKKVGEYERPEYTQNLLRARNTLLKRDFDPIYFNE